MSNNYFLPARHRRCWPSLWFLLAASLATAQPTLVKDIVTSGTDPLTGANSFKPGSLTGVNGVVYFSAFDPVNGRELWRSDGTPAGTFMLRDIIPGATGSEPTDMAAVNNTLYFSANDGKSGRELWKTDGTLVGTVRVKDITVGTAGSSPTNLVGVGGTLYFSANDGSSGRELWKSDGTSGGTVRVKDIWVGTGDADPYSLFNVNGTLFFVADDGLTGKELWKSNGTSTGTVRVLDMNPHWHSFGSDFWTSPHMTLLNGTLYFIATKGYPDWSIWKTNGTEAGTVLVADVDCTDGWGPRNLASANGLLYFSGYRNRDESDNIAGDNSLWKSDGTQEGTVLVKATKSEAGYNISSDPKGMTNVNGTVFFSANSEFEGRELWKTDGTEAGTVMVKDLLPGREWVKDPYGPGTSREMPRSSNPNNFINVNGMLFCTSENGLWKSDGTASGTVLIKPLFESTNLIYVNGALFLGGRDNAGGSELWKSNGTSTGTMRLDGKGSRWPAGANPQHGVNMGGTLYFSAGSPARGYELWKSEGTNATTTLVKKIGPQLQGLTNAGGKLYFVGNDGISGPELWKSNGTAAGTLMVKDIHPGLPGSGADSLAVLSGVVYFSADDGTNGTELWRSDGTTGGTYMVKNIFPGQETYYDWKNKRYNTRTASSNPQGLISMNGFVYFSANSSNYGLGELWRTDGTATGTVLIKDIKTGTEWPDGYERPSGSRSQYLTSLNGTLYFISDDGNGHSLWKSNGTAAGTVEVKDVPARQLLKASSLLYFWGNAGQLWKSNGTTAGTTLVKSIAGSANEQFLTSVGSVLYFTTEHASYGRELWRSDGTGAGTYLLKNIAPGTTGSAIASYAILGNDLYFSAAPAGETAALWKSNGTTAGTVKVSSMQVSGLTAMIGQLYFSGNDGTTGFELWKYNPTTCVTPSTTTALQGSTVCLGSPATVTVKGAQVGVRYGLYYSGTLFGLQKVGNGMDLSFAIPAASLFTGSYTFSVRAEGCREVALTATATVTVTPPLAAPAASGVTINSRQTATLTASGAPMGATYRWYATASGGTPLATTATYTTPALTATTTYYVALYRLPCGESPRRAVIVTVNGGTVARSFRVNAGGSAFSTIDARNFSADVYFAGGVVTTPTSLAIAGTADDFLYQTGRHGTSFTYNFPTSSGSYDVILHFAETYYGNTAPGGTGSRKFHVDAEGVRRLTDYDVFAKAGGALRAKQETFRVNVSDGTLSLAFLKGSADNPAVKAIEILPAGSALAINAGGNAFTTGAGKRFSADVYYADGSPSTAVTGDVLNTTNDALYQTGRSGPAFSYGLPSGNGTFDVTLHFAETYYGHRVAGGVGSRKFNVFLEGVKQLSDYDIFAKAGGAMRAVKETRRVTVSDGVLNLYFAQGLAGNAYVSAVEVVPVAVAARESAEAEAGTGEWQVQLYPNPVVDELTIRLPFPVEAVQGTVVADAAGVALLVNAHRATAAGILLVRVSELKRGLYLLHLDTDRGRRVIKFIKQ